MSNLPKVINDDIEIYLKYKWFTDWLDKQIVTIKKSELTKYQLKKWVAIPPVMRTPIMPATICRAA